MPEAGIPLYIEAPDYRKQPPPDVEEGDEEHPSVVEVDIGTGQPTGEKGKGDGRAGIVIDINEQE